MKTNEKDFRKNDEMISLNQNLYNEFEIQELEERLETDPLSFANVVQGGASPDCILEIHCICDDLSCICDDLNCMCDDFDCLCQDFCLTDGWWE